MRLRLFRQGLLVVTVGLGTALAGCETRKQMVDRRDPDEAIAAAKYRAEALEADRADDLRASTVAKGFFKNNRLQGGWSDQANEIEESLGVGR